MKILISGATGFIGSRLSLLARQDGHEVVATGRRNNAVETSRSEALERAGVHLIEGSLVDAQFARRVTEGCHGIIHLAAAQHESNVPDEYFRQVNVDGTSTLLDAAVSQGVRRFVYGSTIGVYGSAAEGKLDEASPPHPVNVYGRTKLEAESVVRGYSDRLEQSIIRISETYGPGDFRLLKLFKAIKRGRFAVVGAGDNLHQVIHVDDLSRGLLLGLTHPAAVGETFVLAGQEVMSTREMVARVAAAVDRPAPGLRVPLWPFLAAAVVMEKTLPPLGIEPPLHRRRLDFFRKSFLFSVDKARDRLGFAPQIGFADGARATAGWYAEQRLL